MLGTTLNFKMSRQLKFSQTDIIALFVLISYIVGFLISVFIIRSDNKIFLSYGKAIFESFIDFISNGGFIKQVAFYLINFFIFLLFGYFHGANIFGAALIPATILLKGAYESFVISYCYHTFALNGVVFALLTFVPYSVMSSFLLILAFRESVCFSSLILKNSLPSGTVYSLSGDFKLFSIRYLLILISGFAISTICAVFSVIFFDYFSF